MTLNTREQIAYENWGWMAVRGAIALLLGLVVIVWPGPSLAALVVLIGALLLVDGIAALVYSASGGRTHRGNAWPLVLAGLAGIGGAIITYIWPEITAGILLFIVAFWAISRGVLEIIAYMELRHVFRSSWLLGLSGALALAFGVILLAWPSVGLQLLAWLVGVYAIIAGAVFIGLATSMRRVLHDAANDPPSFERPGEPTPI